MSDPLREYISHFGSGLELLWEALRHKHDSKTRRSILALGIRCLVIQTIVDIVAFIAPTRFSVNRQLFYPAVLLYRYVRPHPWDRLFMKTVQSLGCSDRSDIVAKPIPPYFPLLKRHCRRWFKAYMGIMILQWLVSKTGIFSLPKKGLALLAIDLALHYQFRGIRRSFWKLVVLTLVVGLQWPVWAVQTLMLQQLLMYDLLQPYLARVHFKRWQERAWLSQYAVELQGFAFGAWMLCSIPWVGVAAIPFLFSAVAFLLSRSCGSMECSRHELGGGFGERLNPGSKDVAHGKSKAVRGDWEGGQVTTFVGSTSAKVYNPKGHSRGSTQTYYLGNSLVESATAEQIQSDKEQPMWLKSELYKEDPRLRLRSQYSHIQSHDGTATDFFRDEGIPLGSASQKDITMYNFSDRKTLDSAPSAPPEEAFSRMDCEPEHEDHSFWIESGTGNGQSFTPYPGHQFERTRENKTRVMMAKRHAKEQKRLLKERMRAAKDARRSAEGLTQESIEAEEIQEEQEEGQEKSDTLNASGLSAAITQSVQTIEQQVSQQMEGWARQAAKRVRDTLVDPDDPW
ncbi:hypothetical protein EDD11_007470 [Mortierella claussenii]|nr:hypothetical protein EDD11_007470 [Mortierella claussenii]